VVESKSVFHIKSPKRRVILVTRILCRFLVVAVLPAPTIAHDLQANATEAYEDALGVVSFETTCNEEVTAAFNRAVALLHSFWFDAAIDAFESVLDRDPTCAMAEWGIALSHWGNPLSSERTAEHMRLGAAAVDRAQELAPTTAREQGYIAAVAELYMDFDSKSAESRSTAFEKAMEDVVEAYPADTEAVIFLARALFANAESHDKTYAKQIHAAKLLEPIFSAQPNHPGVAHYIIHSYDVPSLAVRALPAAQKYADIAPTSPHALHMPSHTFTRLGYWKESIATNRRSAEAALNAGSPGEALHALDYMIYAYLQTGQDEAARAVVNRSREIYMDVDRDDRYATASAYAISAIPARFVLERSAWQESMSLESAGSGVPYIDAITHFARGLGAARSGDQANAQSAVESLKAIHTQLQDRPFWKEKVRVQMMSVAAWAELAAGDKGTAHRMMQDAADLEAGTEKAAISPGPIAPARELLAEMLMEMQRPEKALEEYERLIEKEPGRFRALYGGGIAADAVGNKALARNYFERLVKMCPDGTQSRLALVHARTYLASQ